MRRITLWALSTLTTVVLLFSYHTSTSSRSATSASPVVAPALAGQSGGDTSGSSGSGDSSGSSGTDGSSGGSTPTPTPSASSTPKSSSASKTYAGDAVSTRFGNVQVQITVAGGRITTAEVLQVPWNDRRDQEINSSAVPVLNDEVVSAQSATIDMVSGATFTSEGYIQSLQSAIDQAHL
jgi:uncharacterized protein with FMN-binding domain